MEEFQEILELIQASYFLKILKQSLWILFFIIWIGSISFVIKDAKKRYSKTKYQYLIVLLPLCLHLAGLLIYFLIRPATTKAERVYEKEILSLEEDIDSCPYCKTEIKDKFIFCPNCGKEVFDHCPNCSKPVKKTWKYCPYCRTKL